MTFWPEKFITDTADMTPDAAAYYSILLMHAWVRGGALPNDHAMLRLMMRMTRQRWNQLWGEISEKWFVGSDGQLHQKRLDTEWQQAERRRGKAVAKRRARFTVVDVAPHKSDTPKLH